MKDLLKYHLKKFYRKGFVFNQILSELEKTQFYSEEQLTNLQNKKLQKIIRHCYNNVPYYTDLFNELKLTPDDIKTKEDLVKLPYTDKAIVKANFDKFIAKNKLKLFCNVGHTSGSSGTPGKFLRDYYSINFENATLWRQWRAVGDTGLKRVVLRGDIIVPVTQTEPPFWKYNPIEKELFMSGYHLSESNSQQYIDKILNFNPDILYAYPSTANLLAGFFDKKGIKYQFKAVFTSSESLSHLQKDYIEKVFACKIIDWYGQAERVVGIGHCEKGTYHINEDYSIVELLPVEGGFEPVGTHLHNYIMPLLRYKTGDTVVLEENNCTCGRKFRTIKEIMGRNVDYITTPEGAKITICNHIPRGVNNILETQFYQDKIGEVVINIVANKDFCDADRDLLIKNTIEHTSINMKVEVRVVDRIPRGANGKFKSVINKLES